MNNNPYTIRENNFLPVHFTGRTFRVHTGIVRVAIPDSDPEHERDLTTRIVLAGEDHHLQEGTIAITVRKTQITVRDEATVQQLQRDMKATQDFLLQYHKTLELRVAWLLDRIAETGDAERHPDGRITLRITQQGIAELLNTNRETVGKVYIALRKKGVLAAGTYGFATIANHALLKSLLVAQ